MGVILSHDLSWNCHILEIVKKARSRCGLVKRTLGADVKFEVKRLCYISLIRPLLEYVTHFWTPYNKNLITQIESIQRNVSKYIVDNNSLNYKQRLIKYELLPLSLRNDFLDLVFIFNSVNDLNDFNIESVASFSDGDGRNMDH